MLSHQTLPKGSLRHAPRGSLLPCLSPARCKPLRQAASAQQDPPAAQQQQQQEAHGRMFSYLNRDLKHDPGSVFGSAMLVAGTTIGAGILALPAVTQDAGFVPSAATLTVVCLFSAATGLLVAEVNLAIMRRQGAGGLSVITMARETLGEQGALASSAAYVFLHYALLVAYMSKAGEIVAGASGIGMGPGAALFSATFALLCYGSSQKLLDQLNSVLVGLVVMSFLGLLGVAAGGVDAGSLTSGGDWSAVPATLPVVALAFVYHNIIPVICTALEGDVAKIRTAVLAGLAIPWTMFVLWDGAILGSLDALTAATSAPAAAVAATRSPATALQVSSPAAAAAAGSVPSQQQWVQQTAAVLPAPQLLASSASFDVAGRVAVADASMHTAANRAAPADGKIEAHVQYGGVGDRAQPQLVQPSLASEPPVVRLLSTQPLADDTPSSSSSSSSSSGGSSSSSSKSSASQRVELAEAASASGSSSSSSTAVASRVQDPLAALSAANPVAAPLIQGFSFLAIATSYIGFILGLTDFLADALALPTGRQAPLPYMITLLPPFVVAVTNPNIFLQALDTAGTYGVLTLFGIQPAAMAWSARYGSNSSMQEQQQIVPGGKALLLAVGGAAAGVILNEVVQLFIKH